MKLRLMLLSLVLMSGCARRELQPDEATRLLTGARVVGTQGDVAIERVYTDEAFVQLGERPGEGHWSYWGGKLCITWKKGGPAGTRCSNHLITDDRGTYWIERQTNAMQEPDIHSNGRGSSGFETEGQSEALAVFTVIEDASSGESRVVVRPFEEVYLRQLFCGGLTGLVVLFLGVVLALPVPEGHEDLRADDESPPDSVV